MESFKVRILTTYNQKIYDFSAHKLIESSRKFLPDVQILEYNEDRVHEIPEFVNVFEANKDIILKAQGGDADSIPSTGGWQFNSRWFNWFKKIAVQYDCIKRNKYNGYTLFFDADIRIINTFSQEQIDLPKAVGIFQGNREIAETGFLILNENNFGVVEFYDQLIQFYLSGEFRKYFRWDDSFSITKIKNRNPDLVEDLAKNAFAGEFTNTNNHSTAQQIIPFTKWGKYVEHDKGIHCRNNIS